jgi:peptide chain release factor subunit 1
VISRERGSVYGLRSGKLRELADLTEDAPSRHDQGGRSQARYQRHIDKLSYEHYKTVAEALGRRFRRLGRPRIVVVATEDGRPEIRDALHSEVEAAVIGWASAEAHSSPAEIAAAVKPVIERWQAECEAEHLDHWREGAGRAGRASSGWEETLTAASDARVELLLYQAGVDHAAVRCPRCGRSQASGETCPLDGTRFEPRDDGLNLAVRQTLAHGGSVWAVRTRPDLEPVGGIGALLRF